MVMSNAYSFNDSRGNSHYKFINTTKTRENSNNLYSVEYDSNYNSKVDLDKNNFVEDRLLESPFLTLQTKIRYLSIFIIDQMKKRENNTP